MLPHKLKIALLWVSLTAIASVGLSIAHAAGQTNIPREISLSSRPYLPPGSTLRVSTREIQVEVVVRDSRGHPVAGLMRDNFKLFDNAKEQTVLSFIVRRTEAAKTSPVSPAPSTGQEAFEPTAERPSVAARSQRPARYVGIYFEDVQTGQGDLRHAQVAAVRFVKEALAPEDRVGIFTTSSDAVPSFTSDVPQLLNAIDKIKAHPRLSQSGFSTCPRITPYAAYLIANDLSPSAFQAALAEADQCHCADEGNFAPDCIKGQENIVRSQAEQTWNQERGVSLDALGNIQSAVGYLAKMPGDRVLLLASSGFLVGTLEPLEQSIVDLALRAGVVIDSLDAKGLYAEGPGRPLSETQNVLRPETFIFETESLGDRLTTTDAIMANLAGSTGGLFIHNRNDLDAGFREMGMVPEVSYLLGFPADDVKSDGKYHKLKVEILNAHDDYVQARPGYYALSKTDSSRPVPQSKMDEAVESRQVLSALPATVTTKSQRSERGVPELLATIHVDLKPLQFQQQQDRKVQRLDFVVALFDTDNNFVSGQQGQIALALGPDSFARLEASGINALLLLQAPRGSYRLRAVAQEALTGKLSASSQSVEFP